MSEVLEGEAPAWPIASRKRLLLAAYLDYLMFGSLWAILVWAVGKFVLVPPTTAWQAGLFFFVLGEIVLRRLDAHLPGEMLLGIRRWSPAAAVFAGAPERRPRVPHVDPNLLAQERWWTMLFGTLVILDGAKSMVRWTEWAPPDLLMGHRLDATSSALLRVATGIAEFAVGAAALRLEAWPLMAGLALTVGMLVSTVLSWELIPDWAAEYQTARRSWQGIPPRGDEISNARLWGGPVMVGSAAWMVIWNSLVLRRARRAPRP